jgi:hypothetical protein
VCVIIDPGAPEQSEQHDADTREYASAGDFGGLLLFLTPVHNCFFTYLMVSP